MNVPLPTEVLPSRVPLLSYESHSVGTQIMMYPPSMIYEDLLLFPLPDRENSAKKMAAYLTKLDRYENEDNVHVTPFTYATDL